MLGTAVQNLVIQATWHLGFVHHGINVNLIISESSLYVNTFSKLRSPGGGIFSNLSLL